MLTILRKSKHKCPERVSGVGTRDGKVYVWLKPPNPAASSTRLFFRAMTDVEKFCVSFNLDFAVLSENVTADWLLVLYLHLMVTSDRLRYLSSISTDLSLLKSFREFELTYICHEHTMLKLYLYSFLSATSYTLVIAGEGNVLCTNFVPCLTLLSVQSLSICPVLIFCEIISMLYCFYPCVDDWHLWWPWRWSELL